MVEPFTLMCANVCFIAHAHMRREVFNELPLEFSAEVNQLMSLKLEGSVG